MIVFLLYLNIIVLFSFFLLRGSLDSFCFEKDRSLEREWGIGLGNYYLVIENLGIFLKWGL